MQVGRAVYRGWPLAIALILAGAWACRFVQDDAFISMRYAANWAAGYGPVFNPGQHLEGYTSFLWVVLLVVPHALGWDAVTFSYVVGMVACAVTLVATWSLAGLLFEDRGREIGLAALVLLGVNYSFLSYATSGMETQLQTACFMVCLCLVLRDRRGPLSLAGLSLLAGAAVLTRPDSVLLVGPPCLVAMAREWDSPGGRASRWLRLGALTTPVTVVVTVWLAWKWRFYGDLLPNTFYLKVPSHVPGIRGLYYAALFFFEYLLWPLALWHVWNLRRYVRAVGGRTTIVTHAPLVLWLAYVVYIGGDFMEFRLLIPVLPLVCLMIGWTLMLTVRRPAWRVGWVGAMAAASCAHALWFPLSPLCRGMEAIPTLRSHLDTDRPGWIAVGKALGEAFHDPMAVTIAVTPAGAIPYYSRAFTIDMLGPNDRYIARQSVTPVHPTGARLRGEGAGLLRRLIGTRPGHSRIANVGYLIQRQVNLLIGHPQPWSPRAGERGHYEASDLGRPFLIPGLPKPSTLPPGTRVVEIPTSEDEGVIAIYMRPNDEVDRAIAQRHWKTYPLAGTPQGG